MIGCSAEPVKRVGAVVAQREMVLGEALAQGILVRHHVTGLTREELPAYLTHRLRLAH
jgi:hypothetical protein